MDDEFFSETLDGKIDAVQFIINTVLERNNLKIIDTKTQREYKSATKRSIKLDIWAQDAEGRIINIEIQKSNQGTGAERARLHSSMIDRDLLEKGQKFDELVETYVTSPKMINTMQVFRCTTLTGPYANLVIRNSATDHTSCT